MLDRLNGELYAELESDCPVKGDMLLPPAGDPGRLDSCSVDVKFLIFFFLRIGFAIDAASSSSSSASHLLFGCCLRILFEELPAGEAVADTDAPRWDVDVLAIGSAIA